MPAAKRPANDPLPSRPSAGHAIGGMLGMLGHLIANRPRPVTEISERYREPWDSADGVTVEGLDEPMERPEPPDRSGARL